MENKGLTKKNKSLTLKKSSLKLNVSSGKEILSFRFHSLMSVFGYFDSRHSCSQARMPFLLKELKNC